MTTKSWMMMTLEDVRCSMPKRAACDLESETTSELVAGGE